MNLRRIVSALAVATTLGAAATLPADASISTTSFCVNVASGQSGFTDIGGVSTSLRHDIECLAASRITSGTTATTYSPTNVVFRDSMATFVAKLVDVANGLELHTLAALPSDAPDAFTDDDASSHEANINRLAAADIVQGKTATTYGPNGFGNEVNRGQMATFLVKALEYLRGDDLPAGGNAFTDDAGSVHEANINKLAAIDVVDGVGGTSYDPNGLVSRAQMAAFLVRSMAWLHSEGDIAALPPSTQTIAISPTGTQTNQTDAAAGGEIAFTASNIQVTDVDLRLLPCENVAFSSAGTSFTDANPNDAMADPNAELVAADIVAVNGTNQPANTIAKTGIAVSNNQITFSLDSPVIDCVVAVVWDDADDDDRIDLDGNDRPTETFGTTGQVVFVPPDAPTGPMDENVFSNDEANNSFIGCELGGSPGAGDLPESGPNAQDDTDCGIFHYDSNDQFFIRNDADLVGDPDEAVSLAVFEAALGQFDDVAGNYQATAASQSSFVLVDEAPAGPTGTAVTTVDGDTLAVTFDEMAGVDSYRVYRNADPGPTCPAFTTTGGDPYVLAGTVTGGSADADAGTTDTFTDNGLTAATRYCYAVTSVQQGDEGGPAGTAAGTTGADTVAPRALDAELTVQTNSAALDNGDVIQICFDEDIEDPQDLLDPDSETLTLRDGDGTEGTLTQGGNATFRRPATAIEVGVAGSPTCATDRVLEVLVNTAPASGALAVPATILLSTGVEDLSGNVFAPAASGQDVVVDIENGAEPS